MFQQTCDPCPCHKKHLKQQKFWINSEKVDYEKVMVSFKLRMFSFEISIGFVTNMILKIKLNVVARNCQFLYCFLVIFLNRTTEKWSIARGQGFVSNLCNHVSLLRLQCQVQPQSGHPHDVCQGKEYDQVTFMVKN